MERQNPANMAQPKLADLMKRFLHQQAEDRKAGLPEMPVDEVELHEAAFAPQVEPRTAWEEATAALRTLAPYKDSATNSVPPGWANLVQHPASVPAVAFAAGNYPQLIRDLPELIRSHPRASLLEARGSHDVTGIESWTARAIEKKNLSSIFMGTAILRLAGHFDAARKILSGLRADMPAPWKQALANEEATLAWQSGQHEQAYESWKKLPESAPVCFNRGMAALFLDRPNEAKGHLKQAIALLPEDNAWQHLARLYLALAEM
jgi:tetratricopeptide (TPR) repeat protein